MANTINFIAEASVTHDAFSTNYPRTVYTGEQADFGFNPGIYNVDTVAVEVDPGIDTPLMILKNISPGSGDISYGLDSTGSGMFLPHKAVAAFQLDTNQSFWAVGSESGCVLETWAVSVL